jgi:pilus assembly protein CpaB
VSRRRRGALLLGLALLLGGIAASDVARRQAALDRSLGPLRPVLVARTALPANTALDAARLSVRRMPGRFAPPGALGDAGSVTGLRTRVALRPGTPLTPDLLADPSAGRAAAPTHPGERVTEIVARADPQLVAAGSRVDVLVTRDSGTDSGTGRTRVGLRDVEVLAARRVSTPDDRDALPGPRVSATVRVTSAEARYLSEAEAYARDVQLLARAPGR